MTSWKLETSAVLAWRVFIILQLTVGSTPVQLKKQDLSWAGVVPLARGVSCADYYRVGRRPLFDTGHGHFKAKLQKFNLGKLNVPNSSSQSYCLIFSFSVESPTT